MKYFKKEYMLISENELTNIVGGLAVTIMGVTYVGAKAAAILAGGGAALGGIGGWGVWIGYNESKRQ